VLLVALLIHIWKGTKRKERKEKEKERKEKERKEKERKGKKRKETKGVSISNYKLLSEFKVKVSAILYGLIFV
jgi:F0F1-type ATP synthase assembly protein I